MSGFTRGPWLHRGKSDSVHTQIKDYPYGDMIFQFHDEGSPSDSDLALILAAPQLLSALESLLGKAYKQNFNDSYPEILDACESAIAKARGDV